MAIDAKCGFLTWVSILVGSGLGGSIGRSDLQVPNLCVPRHKLGPSEPSASELYQLDQ